MSLGSTLLVASYLTFAILVGHRKPGALQLSAYSHPSQLIFDAARSLTLLFGTCRGITHGQFSQQASMQQHRAGAVCRPGPPANARIGASKLSPFAPAWRPSTGPVPTQAISFGEPGTASQASTTQAARLRSAGHASTSGRSSAVPASCFREASSLPRVNSSSAALNAAAPRPSRPARLSTGGGWLATPWHVDNHELANRPLQAVAEMNAAVQEASRQAAPSAGGAAPSLGWAQQAQPDDLAARATGKFLPNHHGHWYAVSSSKMNHCEQCVGPCANYKNAQRSRICDHKSGVG